ncbi:hypothetical protein Q4E93_32670 [Flavitalea sp. BT771]|uniref:hypothetical protein n=1 Tax=Flavitalea sp. BT771 TaxID=3063329 RepID=UPI0026E3D00A|nr:hypothetical protein [Flavitalea sp. BT771]MDO6435416.1 hypothetical protein [Flavitalea sp. BT771]MDV6224224.1 hypothetical protein [Flavitalea sp. BT771]
MIRKSIITCVGCFVVYNLFLFVSRGEKKTGQYQYQENIIKAERYLYAAKPYRCVMTGSSLSDKMLVDSLPGMYSLSLPGLHPLDGIRIIESGKYFPDTVFIETNFFFGPEDKSFTGHFDSKIKNTLKRKLPALLESNQPVGIARYFIGSFFHQEKKGSNARVLKNEINIPESVFSRLLRGKAEAYQVIDSAAVDSGLSVLSAEVNTLISHGCKVCFFEMPISPELEDLPMPVYVRQSIEKRFDGMANVGFIRLPASRDYKTLDGIHLNEYGAREYTRYFKSEVMRPGVIK